MQISSISNVAPWTAELTTNLFESKPVTSSLSTTAAHAKSESFTAPVQSSASISAANTLAGYYSAKLDGRSYSGNVEESDGTYTASVMTVPISVASGPSVDSAESNLTVVIDALA